MRQLAEKNGADSSPLRITPQGHLTLDDVTAPPPGVTEATWLKLVSLYKLRLEEVLLYMAVDAKDEFLSPSLAYFRDFTRHYLTRACVLADGEGRYEQAPLLDSSEAARWCDMAPPIYGLEYLNEDSISELWRNIDDFVREKAANCDGGIHGFLGKRNSAWSQTSKGFGRWLNCKDLRLSLRFTQGCLDSRYLF